MTFDIGVSYSKDRLVAIHGELVEISLDEELPLAR